MAPTHPWRQYINMQSTDIIYLVARTKIYFLWYLPPFYCAKATITHWRFLLENRRDTANLRTAEERHKMWRFFFHFHGITAVVRQDTLSCAHVRQQYDRDWSSGGSVAALVRKQHALSRLHDAQSRFAAFVDAQTRCTHVHRCLSALRHHHSRSLAEARQFSALTHDKMKRRRAQ